MTEASRKLQARPTDSASIVSVRDNVYVAVGYDHSYMAMIVGPQDIVVVDAGQDPKISASIMARFRRISDKPLAALVFTHSHPDHVQGAPGVLGMEKARNPQASPAIWARSNYGSEFGLAALLPQVSRLRGQRQFGDALPPGVRSQPLGPASFPDPGTFAPGQPWPILEGPVTPTHFFEGESHSLHVAGLRLELLAMPGETSDHLCLWMPDKRIAFVGDNIYGSFPNLYAVRGSGYRDVAVWANAVAKIRALHPEALVMGHSAPLQSPELCDEWLTNYHEAIHYVFDATINGMNQGMTADELAETVCLPPHLANKEYLTQYYGNVAFSVRSIFNGHLGWFDGDPRKLAPLTLHDEATRMADMAGGADALLQRARNVMAQPLLNTVEHDHDAAWAAQLLGYFLRLHPEHPEAHALLGSALERLGQATLSTSGRNYLLACAQEIRKG